MMTAADHAKIAEVDQAQAALKAHFARLGRARCVEICKGLGASPMMSVNREASLAWIRRAVELLAAAEA